MSPDFPEEEEKKIESKYKFFFTENAPARDFFENLKKSVLDSHINTVKNILKDVLSENKAYYYNNNLLILSKIINSEDKYQEIIKIQLDPQSKCNLINDTIYYFVELSLADFISIKHCFIEEVKEGLPWEETREETERLQLIAEFKKNIKNKFKSKTNLLKDTIVTDKSESDKNTYKSETMKDSFLEISEAEKKKLFAFYIFEKEGQEIKINLNKYKSLLKRQ